MSPLQALETDASKTATARELDELSIQRARRGDEAACRRLYRTYRRLVFSYLWRFLGPRATRQGVEDLTQETFLKVFRSLSTYRTDGPARLSTWAVTIAHRTAINHVRKVRPTDPGKKAGEERLAAVAGRAGVDDRLDARQRLEAAFADLSDDHRHVLLLHDAYELTVEETARALEVPAGTVKSRLSRARVALKEILEQ